MLCNPVYITLRDRGIDVQQLYDNMCLHNGLVGPLSSAKPVVYTPVRTLTKGNELHRSGRGDRHFHLSPESVFDHCSSIYLPLIWCLCVIVCVYVCVYVCTCACFTLISKIHILLAK